MLAGRLALSHPCQQIQNHLPLKVRFRADKRGGRRIDFGAGRVKWGSDGDEGGHGRFGKGMALVAVAATKS